MSFQKGIHGMEKVSNSVIWDQIGKEDVKELTSGIAERYENHPHSQLALLNKDKTENRV